MKQVEEVVNKKELLADVSLCGRGRDVEPELQPIDLAVVLALDVVLGLADLRFEDGESSFAQYRRTQLCSGVIQLVF